MGLGEGFGFAFGFGLGLGPGLGLPAHDLYQAVLQTPLIGCVGVKVKEEKRSEAKRREEKR